MLRCVLFLAAAAVLVFISPLSAIESDRDFSGTWVLDRGASDLRGLNGQPQAILVIDQKELSIQCKSGTSQWSFTADRNESRYQIGAESHNTVAKWEGAALLINTLVSGPSNYTVMDRWKLASNRSTLRIERQLQQRSGIAESVLVYRREGAMAEAPAVLAVSTPAPSALSPRAEPPAGNDVVVKTGTRIPLGLINSLNTKRTRDGDRVYLETVFPIAIDGRIVIPRRSAVAGTVTQARQAGRVKGKSEIYIRFDSLTLPNGVTRDFRARLGNADASGSMGQVDRNEGKISGDSNKGDDARTVGQTTGAGATIGGITGAISGHPGMGAGIGAAAGAAAGLAAVLMGRGPEVVLPRGTTLEMVLDRDLRFTQAELRF